MISTPHPRRLAALFVVVTLTVTNLLAVTPTSTAANPDGIVTLSREAMVSIHGGQRVGDVICSDYQIIGAYLTWVAMGSSLTPILVRCAVATEVDILDAEVYHGVYDSVYYWLTTLNDSWVAAGLHYVEQVDVYGRYQDVDTVEPDMLPFTTGTDLIGIWEDDYCGYTDCYCDYDSDCFSYWCQDGYCMPDAG